MLHEVNLKILISGPAVRMSPLDPQATKTEDLFKTMLYRVVKEAFHLQTPYEVVDFKMTEKLRKHH
jgi:hypothetical protein